MAWESSSQRDHGISGPKDVTQSGVERARRDSNRVKLAPHGGYEEITFWLVN